MRKKEENVLGLGTETRRQGVGFGPASTKAIRRRSRSALVWSVEVGGAQEPRAIDSGGGRDEQGHLNPAGLVLISAAGDEEGRPNGVQCVMLVEKNRFERVSSCAVVLLTDSSLSLSHDLPCWPSNKTTEGHERTNWIVRRCLGNPASAPTLM